MGIILLAGIVIFYFLFIKGNKLPDRFNAIELDRILKDRLNGTIKIIDEKDKRFGALRRGRTTIGNVKRHGVVTFENDKPRMPWEHNENLNIKNDDKQKDNKFKKLHLFEISTGRGLFGIIQEILRMNLELLIIPDYLVSEHTLEAGDSNISYFNLKKDVDIVSFGSVYLYGLDSFDYVKGQAWLYGREKELEELINYPKRAVYLDTRHSKHTEELEKIYALDEKRRKGYLDSMLPGKKTKN